MDKKFPIPVELFREHLKNPIADMDMDLIKKEGSHAYLRKRVGRISFKENVRKYFSILSIDTILMQELAVKLLGEMRSYLETHNDHDIQKDAVEIMGNLCILINTGQGQGGLYLKENPDTLEADRRVVMARANNTWKLLVQYLNTRVNQYCAAGYMEKFPSLQDLGWIAREMRQHFYLLGTKGIQKPANLFIAGVKMTAKDGKFDFDQYDRFLKAYTDVMDEIGANFAHALGHREG